MVRWSAVIATNTSDTVFQSSCILHHTQTKLFRVYVPRVTKPCYLNALIFGRSIMLTGIFDLLASDSRAPHRPTVGGRGAERCQLGDLSLHSRRRCAIRRHPARIPVGWQQ